MKSGKLLGGGGGRRSNFYSTLQYVLKYYFHKKIRRAVYSFSKPSYQIIYIVEVEVASALKHSRLKTPFQNKCRGLQQSMVQEFFATFVFLPVFQKVKILNKNEGIIHYYFGKYRSVYYCDFGTNKSKIPGFGNHYIVTLIYCF